ncbi:hypothetical protein [Pseudomonas sp. NPDC007930]|uniref:hypothetical protein n=1 Tax=Pseudomonas sp. NPDC007930 TaxID=3364417 RepID=UPI0036EDA436
MTPLELRHTIEAGLLPLKSQTSIDERGMLQVTVEVRPGQRFVAEPVQVETLGSTRAILNLIGALKADIAAGKPARRRQRR